MAGRKLLVWNCSKRNGLLRYDSVGGRFTVAQVRIFSTSRFGVDYLTGWVFLDRRDGLLTDVDNLRHGREQAQISFNDSRRLRIV